MFGTKIEVEIRNATNAGKIEAFADVRFLLSDGELFIRGFAIIRQREGSRWVGFPQMPGRNKFFNIVEATGRIEREINKAVLDAFRESKEEGS
jgi:DNA-binding cell septation regulator SpoVG